MLPLLAKFWVMLMKFCLCSRNFRFYLWNFAFAYEIFAFVHEIFAFSRKNLPFLLRFRLSPFCPLTRLPHPPHVLSTLCNHHTSILTSFQGKTHHQTLVSTIFPSRAPSQPHFRRSSPTTPTFIPWFSLLLYNGGVPRSKKTFPSSSSQQHSTTKQRQKAKAKGLKSQMGKAKASEWEFA